MLVWVMAILLGLFGGLSTAYSEESHPGLAAEARYAEAVIAYNKKQTQEALEILEDLLKRAPQHVEALELKALTLKSTGDDTQAIQVYRSLIKIKPSAERGPYYFELGTIYNRQKKPEFARPMFEAAVARKFNVAASRLFLGVMAFGAGDLGRAEEQFTPVRSEGSAELKLVATYYLGLLKFKRGASGEGMQDLVEVRELSRELPESKMAADIGQSAEKILAPFKNGQWFASLSFLSGYDSNISQISTTAAASAPSNQSTTKGALQGGFGYMRSPLATLQPVVNYRLSLNKNLNSLTKNYEYLTNTGAFYLNIKPLNLLSGGFKTELNYAFQNQPRITGDTSGAYVYRQYNFTKEFGPYLKVALGGGVQLQLDTGFRLQTYYDTPEQDGNLYNARLSVRKDLGERYFSPGASLSYEKNQAEGDDFKTTALGLGVSNTFRFSGANSFTLSVDYLKTDYPMHSSARADSTVTGRVSWVKAMTGSWSLLGDFGYTANTSTVSASYSYNRFSASFGPGWTL